MRNLAPSLETLFRDALSRHGLWQHYGVIRPHARLTFLMRVSPSDDVPIGVSRLGGTPDLPRNEEWARNLDDDLLLDFIGQINLAQLPALGQAFPEKGLLLIYSLQESAAENPHAIQYFTEPTESLTRADVPAADSYSDEDTDEPFGSLLVTEFVPSISLPDGLATFPNFDDETHDAYSKMIQELHDDPAQKEPTSRLLGYPFDGFGTDVPNEGLELLIEVQSHFHAGKCYMNFWDAGCLQLIVQSDEIPSCRFTKTQSGIFSM